MTMRNPHRHQTTVRPAHRRIFRRTDGPEANARLTGSTAALLLVLLAAEGVTIPFVGPLLTAHVVIGMILVPPLLVKIGSTGYRFIRYYQGDPAYRRKGPPPALLRLLGPFVVVLTVIVVASGIALLFAGNRWITDLLLIHRASFILWFGATTVHVLGHLSDTARLAPRDWYGRARRDIAGAGVRQWLLVASLAVGALLAVAVVGQIGSYRVRRDASRHGAVSALAVGARARTLQLGRSEAALPFFRPELERDPPACRAHRK
jgi:hypothetical protein